MSERLSMTLNSWNFPIIVDGMVLFIPGLNMVVKSDDFSKLGGFNGHFSFSCEDSEFCLRARKGGYRLGFNPRQILFHRAPETYIELLTKFFKYGFCNGKLGKTILENTWNEMEIVPIFEGIEKIKKEPTIVVGRYIKDIIYRFGKLIGKMV